MFTQPKAAFPPEMWDHCEIVLRGICFSWANKNASLTNYSALVKTAQSESRLIKCFSSWKHNIGHLWRKCSLTWASLLQCNKLARFFLQSYTGLQNWCKYSGHVQVYIISVQTSKPEYYTMKSWIPSVIPIWQVMDSHEGKDRILTLLGMHWSPLCLNVKLQRK